MGWPGFLLEEYGKKTTNFLGHKLAMFNRHTQISMFEYWNLPIFAASQRDVPCHLCHFWGGSPWWPPSTLRSSQRMSWIIQMPRRQPGLKLRSETKNSSSSHSPELGWSRHFRILRGLLYLFYQCDNWSVSNWRLACHISFCWKSVFLSLGVFMCCAGSWSHGRLNVPPNTTHPQTKPWWM